MGHLISLHHSADEVVDFSVAFSLVNCEPMGKQTSRTNLVRTFNENRKMLLYSAKLLTVRFKRSTHHSVAMEAPYCFIFVRNGYYCLFITLTLGWGSVAIDSASNTFWAPGRFGELSLRLLCFLCLWPLEICII